MKRSVPGALAMGRRGGGLGRRRCRFQRNAFDRGVVRVVATHCAAVMWVRRSSRIVLYVGRAVRLRAAMQHGRRGHRLDWQRRDENPHQGTTKPDRHQQSLRDRGKTLTTNGSSRAPQPFFKSGLAFPIRRRCYSEAGRNRPRCRRCATSSRTGIRASASCRRLGSEPRSHD